MDSNQYDIDIIDQDPIALCYTIDVHLWCLYSTILRSGVFNQYLYLTKNNYHGTQMKLPGIITTGFFVSARCGKGEASYLNASLANP